MTSSLAALEDLVHRAVEAMRAEIPAGTSSASDEVLATCQTATTAMLAEFRSSMQHDIEALKVENGQNTEQFATLLNAETAARMGMAQRLEVESAARIAMAQRLDAHCDMQRQVCEELRSEADAASERLYRLELEHSEAAARPGPAVNASLASQPSEVQSPMAAGQACTSLRVELDMALERLTRLETGAMQSVGLDTEESRLLHQHQDVISRLLDRVSQLEKMCETDHAWRERTLQRMEQSLGQHGEEIRRFSQSFEARCVTSGKNQTEMCTELCAGLERLANVEARVGEIVV